VKPVVNQIEMNPFLWRKNTFDFFTAHEIAIQSYRALRQGKEMENPGKRDLVKCQKRPITSQFRVTGL
jgi:diketogulonate reductase-like aldo/keto reductase